MFLRLIHNFGSLSFVLTFSIDGNCKSNCSVNSPVTNPKAEWSAFDCLFLEKSQFN